MYSLGTKVYKIIEMLSKKWWKKTLGTDNNKYQDLNKI